MKVPAKRALHLSSLSYSSIVRWLAIVLALAATLFLPRLALNRVQSAVINLDPAFGSGGKLTTDFGPNFQDFGNALALQPDGKIVVVGGGPDFAVARYNTDGSLDDGTINDLTPGDSFGSGGKVTTDIFFGDEAHAVAVQSDGKYVVAGSICPGGLGCGFGLVRYNTDGSLDDGTTNDSTPGDSFGSGGMVRTTFNPFLRDDVALALAVQTDGKLVAAGRAFVFTSSFLDSQDFALARYNPDGSLDNTFGSGGQVTTDFGTDTLDDARALALQPDGKIVVAGWALSSDFSFALLRYNANGTLDASFGSGGKVATDFGGQGLGNAVALQPNGQIVMAGTANNNFALARFNPNGSLDTNFDTDGKVTTVFTGNGDEAKAVAIQADGKIVAAGTTVGSGTTSYDFALARYLVPFENTPPGNNVVAQPVDTTTGTTPVTLTFSQIIQPGETSLTTSTTGPAPPTGFKLGNPPTFYEITTSAVFSGSVTICIHYTGVSFTNESKLKLFHREGGVWVNRTTSLNTVNDIICGSVTSLSPFGIFEEEENQVPADLDIDKSDASDPVLLGSNVTYNIEVENKGPGNATGVTVTDTLPANLNFISASAGCTFDMPSHKVTCIIGNLANGQEVKRTIIGQTTAAGMITNTATVTANEPDPDLSNNTDEEKTTVVVGVKSVSLSPNTIKGGKNVTGTVTLIAPAPSNTVVTLSSSNNSVAKPAVSSITIMTGQTSKTFTVKTFAVSSTKTVKIKAAANGTSKEATLTVTR